MLKWLKAHKFEVVLTLILYWLAPYFGIFVGLTMLVCWLLNTYGPPPR